MLHRVLLGSLERFIGALLEHYKGELPLWLAPVQAVVIPLNDSFREYGLKIKQALAEHCIRSEIDTSQDTLNKKIRNAEVNKIPYALIVGEREEKQGAVAVRKKGKGDLGVMPIDEFIRKIKTEIESKGGGCN